MKFEGKVALISVFQPAGVVNGGIECFMAMIFLKILGLGGKKRAGRAGSFLNHILLLFISES